MQAVEDRSSRSAENSRTSLILPLDLTVIALRYQHTSDESAIAACANAGPTLRRILVGTFDRRIKTGMCLANLKKENVRSCIDYYIDVGCLYSLADGSDSRCLRLS
jgi:hypothetical protein